jgi:hypothetical protein
VKAMPVAEERVTVTIPLPKRVFDKVSDSAARAHRSLEDELAGLIESGLTCEINIDAALDEAYEAYLARMRSEGRQPHTAEELWEQMGRVRKEVADELSSR